MSTKKSSASLKFRPSVQKPGIGKKYLPDPTPVKQVLLMVILHVCRRILFVKVEIKLTIYLALSFGLSIITDVLPLPKTYFAKKSNFLNVYFVKWGWAWTILSLSMFTFLTTYVYCCRNIPKIRQHFVRLGIASTLWYTWTMLFNLIEFYTGKCIGAKRFTSKPLCIQNGFKWLGFDISGHIFILIFCNLLIYEEAKAIIGWEGISEMIRKEEYARNGEVDETPLKHLNDMEFEELRKDYVHLTPYVRLMIIWLTVLSLTWDFMMACTIIYFHTMIQKLLGALIAIFTWFLLYRYLYLKVPYPGLPGDGNFKYSKEEPATTNRRMSYYHKRSNTSHTFMGIPIINADNISEEENDNKAS